MKQLVTTPEQLSDVVDYFTQKDAFAFDVETVGTYRGVSAVNDVSWISLATEGAGVVIPLGHPNGYELLRKASKKKNKATGGWDQFPAVFSEPPKHMRPGRVFEALEPLFFSSKLKIAHNMPFDALSVAKYYGGKYPEPPYADTLVAAWLVNENRPLGLKALTKTRYGLTYDSENVGKCVEKHVFGKVSDYSYIDSKITWLHWQYLERELAREEISTPWREPRCGITSMWDLEMEVLHCLLHMQQPGAPIDRAALEELRVTLRAQMLDVETDLYKEAGCVFNLNSAPQKAKLLYTDIGLEPKGFTDTGAPSTDADALSHYKGKNKVVDLILAYQDVSKLCTTYVEGYLGTDEKPTQIFNGKIYPSFKQYGTVTGRFSCSAPNVQNWPRPDTANGRAIRDLFVPPPGFKLLVADYAQIEQRILAHFAGVGALWQGFWDGVDAHTATASAVFGVLPEDVTKEMRQVAKAIAFAINYGAGAGKVAEMAGITLRKAQKILATHEEVFPEVYDYKLRLLNTVRRRRPTPYLRTLLGRKRRLPGLLSPIPSQRSQAERQVVNSHIQGSNADMTKLAMVRFNKARLPGMQLMLTVHDELAALCPEDIAEEGARVLHDAMAGKEMQLLSVPVTTDVKIVNRWSEAK